MPRYFIELTYKGTAYCGWQRQINAPSVQQTIEEGLSTLLKTTISIIGAGRTDTGVHAMFYVAHFDAPEIEDPADLAYHLNCLLPKDIAIFKIYQVSPQAHARFDARYREYKYFITTRKDPFNRDLRWFLPYSLNIDSMQTAATKLMTYEDFTSFARLHSDNKTNLCYIYKSTWETSGDTIIFTVGANRFLRGMVRAMVGTIVDVGRGKLSVRQFQDILEAKDRSIASGAAPAEGLFLTDVKYDLSVPKPVAEDTKTE